MVGDTSGTDALTETLNTRARQFRACPTFSKLCADELAQIAAVATDVNIDSGHVFIRQDDNSDCFYVIVSGQVLVFGVFDSGNGEMTHSPLATLGPGETIGEMGYFSGGRRTASARALEPTHMLRLGYDQLPAIFDSIPSLAAGFLSIITQRLRELNFQYHASAHRRRSAERSLKHLGEYLDQSGHLDLRLDIEQGIEVLIKRVVTTASKVMNADRATLFLRDPSTGDLWSKVAEGENTREIRVPSGRGLVGWVAANGQLLNVPDAYQDERFNVEVDLRTGYRTRSILCGAVRNMQGEIIGVIQVINKKVDNFDDPVPFNSEDETLFKAFSHQAAIAVENFNLFRQLRDSHEKIALMLDVATSLTQTLELPQLIRRIVTKVKEILMCDRASYFVLDREADELWSMEASGSTLKEIRFPASAGLAGHTARTGTVLNIADAYEDQRFNPAFDKQTGYRTKSVLCVPVVDRQDQVTGVVQAINKADGSPFESDDIAFLKAISSQIGVAVDNAQLYARTAAMKNYLQSVQESIASGIVTVDNGYHVVTANRVALGLLRQPSEQVIGCDLRELLAPPTKGLIGLVDRVYNGQKAAEGFDLDFVSASSINERSVVNAHVLPLNNAEGMRQGLVLVLDDITRERRALGTLSRYLAKEVADRLMDNPELLRLGGVRGKATILFSDIREFTTISEGMTAEQVVDLLNGYFKLMVEEVFQQQGMLDKFIGDAMMALYGVPIPKPDDAVRAVRSALKMQAALQNYNAQRKRSGTRPIAIGIGINTGDVVSGNIGSERQMNFTVIGDEVNTASRLEGLNKYYGTQILISQTTRDEVKDYFELRLIDHVLVVGKSMSVPIYEVMGEKGHPRTPGQHCFPSAFDHYQAGRFREALAGFRQGSVDDPVCRVFIARCEHLVAYPPPGEWNGVWRATGK